jgi:serine/threonine protein kinase
MTIACVLVWYGSYRYEVVARREAEARALGQYVLGERIGVGGMGEVYRGEHRMLRRPVAIKLITPEQAGSQDAISRFEREAQATAQLTHPNTVQVFDYGRADDGTFYCVMEYLPGRTLEQVVSEEGPLPLVRAVAVLTQVSGALAEAHKAGLVHRDIKPSNVMLTERGGISDVAKLLDFGLVASRQAVGEGRLTEAGMFVGTPEYMSPEQCSGADADLGPRSDIYSLGALGYYLLTGASPFAGRNAMQMLAAHVYEMPAAPSGKRPAISPALDAAILRALAKDPAARFSDATEFATALRASVGEG